jgi:hypothetical protein
LARIGFQELLEKITVIVILPDISLIAVNRMNSAGFFALW